MHLNRTAPNSSDATAAGWFLKAAKQGGKNRISFFDSRGKSQSIDQERPNELED